MITPSKELKNEINKNLKKKFDHPITLDNISNEMQYQRHMPIRPTLHIGQRKLFLTEVQFLSNYLDSYDDPGYVVYAGAAPSSHTGFLSELFPNIKFILVDPNEFYIYLPDRFNHNYIKENNIIYLKSGNDIERYKIKEKEKKVNYFNGRKVDFIDVKDAKELNENYLEFIVKSKYSIFIIQDLFTNQLAEELSQLECYFWSDIRTEGGDEAPGDFDLLWNLSMQYNWMKIINPISSMLKFRTPFFNEVEKTLKLIKEGNEDFKLSKKYGLDIINSYKKKNLRYPRGKIYIQAWPGETSSETRLIIDNSDILIDYDYHEYEDKLFWYNNVERPYCYHINKFIVESEGFDNCGDCALEGKIYEDYEKIYGKKIDINYMLQRAKYLSGGRELIKFGHGKLYDNIRWTTVEDMMLEAFEKTWRKH